MQMWPMFIAVKNMGIKGVIENVKDNMPLVM